MYDEVTGDLIKVYDNAGQETTYIYDKMHRLLSEKDIQGLVTSYTYDVFGNLTSKTTPDGNTTSYTDDGTGENTTGSSSNRNGNNGNGNQGNDKFDAWKENGEKEDKEKSNGKTKEHSNNGHDKNLNENGKGHAYGKNKDKSNNGKHKGNNNGNDNNNPNKPDKPNNPDIPNNGDEYDLTNPEIFKVTNYINDINQEFTQVLMTTDIDGNYRGVYTYGNGERISVEDLGHVEGVPNNPLYYLSDALGSTIAITNMNAGIIDNNRFAPCGEPLSPVAKNSRLTNSPWGFAGESHDTQAGLLYLRARYYEPGTGRFIQQDSYLGDIKNPLSLNLYIYCEGNPTIYNNPSGHTKKKYLPDTFIEGKNVYVYCTTKSNGNNVFKVEKNLYDLDYFRYRVNAVYDNNTMFAVKRFQKDYKLYQNGNVDQRVMAFLDAADKVKKVKKLHMSKDDFESYKKGMFVVANNVPYKFPPDSSDYINFIVNWEDGYKNKIFDAGKFIGSFLPVAEVAVSAINIIDILKNYDGYSEKNRAIIIEVLGILPLGDLSKSMKYSDEGVSALKYVDEITEGTSSLKYADDITEGGSTLIRSANPNEIRFSQSSVNGLDKIAASMKKNGWVGDPIDVVRMSDGKLTTIDNTRVLAAREAGIDVKMIVHEADEALPSNFVDRFTTKKGVPTTWEEAVQLRIQKQNSTFRNANPNGAYEMK